MTERQRGLQMITPFLPLPSELYPPKAWAMSLALTLALGICGLLTSGCASINSTSFDRARMLGPGHMEAGVSLATGRTPGHRQKILPEDPEDNLEGVSTSVVVPSAHFRAGLTPTLDGGIRVAPTSVDLSLKHRLRDRDDFMAAVIATAGIFSTKAVDARMTNRQATTAPRLELSLPVARRFSWFAEGLIRPNLGFMTTHVERDRPEGSPGRVSSSAWSLQGGLALGGSFAAWRIRINPEINFLAAWRSDHGAFIVSAYPGIAAFLVY